jgi:plasmid maintenance system antidote protein VapI
VASSGERELEKVPVEVKDFRVSSELWLGLQADFELRVARRRIGPEIDRRVHEYVA